MIDVGKLKAAVGEGPGDEVIPAEFTRDYLSQVIDDLVAGREATEELERVREGEGRVFGLPSEKRL